MFSRRIFSRHTLSLVVAAGAMALSAAASALTVKPYSPAALEAAQGGEGSVALHFHAPWCPVCRQQDKVLGTKSDPALDKVTLLLVDYDSSTKLRKAMNVEAQSTFVVYKGRSEVARNTGEIDPAKIRSTLMQGL
jgi:thioredoxin 1